MINTKIFKIRGRVCCIHELLREETTCVTNEQRQFISIWCVGTLYVSLTWRDGQWESSAERSTAEQLCVQRCRNAKVLLLLEVVEKGWWSVSQSVSELCCQWTNFLTRLQPTSNRHAACGVTHELCVNGKPAGKFSFSLRVSACLRCCPDRCCLAHSSDSSLAECSRNCVRESFATLHLCAHYLRNKV